VSEQSAQAKYTISVAADLASARPQTLRDYESKGLLHPHRTAGNTRLYSDDDLESVRRIQALIALGVNLAGVEVIVRLQDDLDDLRARYERLEAQVRQGRRERA
jgi:MerR family transcriptional regulator/heat shock protein HspR